MPKETPYKLFGVNIAGAEFDTTPFYEGQNYKGYIYFHDKGLTLVRLPFTWERIQPVLNKSFTSSIIDYTNMILAAEKAGEKIIIDPHNYARYNHKPLTKNDVASFSDFWFRLANVYGKNYPGIWGYELMNEPHDLQGGCNTWKILSQEAVNAIRKVDTTHFILISGYDWQSANRWTSSSGCLIDIHDPSHRLVFSAHQYFDHNFTGTDYTNTSCNDTTRGAKLITPFLQWLHNHHQKGIVTEYGVPGKSTCWLKTLDVFMQTLQKNPDIIGGTYWAAGSHWGNYQLSVEPGTTDKPQMSILKQYPSEE